MTDAIIKVSAVQAAAKVTGLPGLKGEKGDGSMLEHITPIALGSNRVAAMTANGIDYADPNASGETLGFTKYAVTENNLATILFNGNLNGFSGLTIGTPIYLASNGTITQTAPNTGTVQCLGVAISSNTINIQIQPKILIE